MRGVDQPTQDVILYCHTGPPFNTLASLSFSHRVLQAELRDGLRRFQPRGVVPEHERRLARAVEEGSLSLTALVWQPSEDGEGWSREKAFVARAVCAYMAHEHAKVRAGGDEDAEADAANDHAYLRSVLKLEEAKNPFSTFDTSATGV